MLGASDIGHRVVVRRVVGVRDGRPLFTDALGVLTSYTDTELTMARQAVIAGKRVPPRPPRRTRRPGAESDR